MDDSRHASSRSRIERIDRYYHRRRSADRRTRSLATGLGVAAALGLVGALLAGSAPTGGEGAWAFSSGPLAGPHAAFESDCSACHTRSFAAISDAACLACHEGPSHHPNLIEEPRCVSCHSEHRGRAASLTELDDQACVVCHGELLVSSPEGPRPSERLDAHIASFTKDDGAGSPGHGEFAVLKEKKPREDRNRITFSHKFHMSKEQVRLPDWEHADLIRIRGSERLLGFAARVSEAMVLDLSMEDFRRLLEERAAKKVVKKEGKESDEERRAREKEEGRVEAAKNALARIDSAGANQAYAYQVEKHAWREPRTYVLERSGRIRDFAPEDVEVERSSPDRLRALSCKDCHEPLGDGAYLGPIDFERHCQSCHALEAPVPSVSIVTSAGAMGFALGPTRSRRALSRGRPQKDGSVKLVLGVIDALPHGQLGPMRSALQELYLNAAERYGALNPLKARYEVVSTDPNDFENLQRACETWRREQGARAEKAREKVAQLDKLQTLSSRQRMRKRMARKSLREITSSSRRFDELAERLGRAAAGEARALLEQMARIAKIDRPTPDPKHSIKLVSPVRFAATAVEEGLVALAKGRCGDCHDKDRRPLRDHQLPTRRYEELADRREAESKGFVFEARLTTDRLIEVAVPRPAIPTRWLTRGAFDHRAHRSFACLDCHPGAASSKGSEDLLLPSVTSCMSCHNDEAARSDCLACHGYHSSSDTRPQGPEDLWQRFGAGEKR